MKTVELRKAKQPLATYVREARNGPLVLTVEGNPVAALVSVRNSDLEAISLSTNAEFLDLIEQSRRDWKKKGGLSPAEMRLRLTPKKTSRRKR